MKWDDVKVFLAVARAGSVSGAGRQLRLQHTTVSRRLRAMEDKLGVRLIERVKGGYGLTPAGEDLKEAGERIEKEVLGVEAVLLGQDQHLKGPLRVTVINHMAYALLMPMFARFSENYPAIELQIQSSNAYISLPQRQADIALRVTNAPADTLVGKKIISFASAVYGSRPYLERLKRTGEPPNWIGTECCNFHRIWTKQQCPNGRHRFVIDDTSLAHAAIREGVGLSFLPCFMGDVDEHLGRYAGVIEDYELDLWMLFHADLKHTARVRVFREFICQEIEKRRELLEGRG
ncbi:MAG: LysR family transcriptional regulator [Agarilytica sp.]